MIALKSYKFVFMLHFRCTFVVLRQQDSRLFLRGTACKVFPADVIFNVNALYTATPIECAGVASFRTAAIDTDLQQLPFEAIIKNKKSPIGGLFQANMRQNAR